MTDDIASNQHFQRLETTNMPRALSSACDQTLHTYFEVIQTPGASMEKNTQYIQSSNLDGTFEVVDDLLGADVSVVVGLSVRRGDEGSHLGQDTLLVGVHVVVDAVPDGCSFPMSDRSDWVRLGPVGSRRIIRWGTPTRSSRCSRSSRSRRSRDGCATEGERGERKIGMGNTCSELLLSGWCSQTYACASCRSYHALS